MLPSKAIVFTGTSGRIVGHSYKGMRGLVNELDLFGSLLNNSAQRRDLSGELFDSERDCYVALSEPITDGMGTFPTC